MLVSVSLSKLFHGLSHGIVDKIIESGFDEVRVPSTPRLRLLSAPLSFPSLRVQRVSNLAGMFGCTSPNWLLR